MSQPTPEAIRLLVRRGAMLTQHHHRGQLYAVGLNLDGDVTIVQRDAWLAAMPDWPLNEAIAATPTLRSERR
ncbi:hypothetical protein RGI145_19465 [Roseomonas gilardii]|uniref:Uncharacterized protein n=1 Tax=Roseomonas gilardii TaxID=257708 RepID=A0A1L7AL68_9PROT|nr:hypothetical protein [Roseomonas gilardii]APT59528.1 hypothetical protein RGI145_19465 [Roseomonas gilardii]